MLEPDIKKIPQGEPYTSFHQEFNNANLPVGQILLANSNPFALYNKGIIKDIHLFVFNGQKSDIEEKHKKESAALTSTDSKQFNVLHWAIISIAAQNSDIEQLAELLKLLGPVAQNTIQQENAYAKSPKDYAKLYQLQDCITLFDKIPPQIEEGQLNSEGVFIKNQ